MFSFGRANRFGRYQSKSVEGAEVTQGYALESRFGAACPKWRPLGVRGKKVNACAPCANPALKTRLMGGHVDERIDEDCLSGLLVAVAAQDAVAFRQLYEMTYAKLNAITARMVWNEADHADILQQAYLAIWRKAGTFDPARGKAFTWLLVVTRNKTLDMLRRSARRGLQEPLNEWLPSQAAPSDNGARSALLRDLMRPHLSQLRPEIRDAVIRHVVHGTTSRQLGEHYGVSTNTAKSWVRRGLKRLRTNLDADASGRLVFEDLI